MKHDIKHIDGRVLYSADVPDDTARRLRTRAALEVATAARADLARANLIGANLARANLIGANLARADLAGAYLASANLARANLAGAYLAGVCLFGANLAGADLAGADLAHANLAGAHLDGANIAGAGLADAVIDGAQKLVGDRPILQIGPFGSRCEYLVAYMTDRGIYVRAGRWLGALADSAARVAEVHGDGVHGQEYAAAIVMIEAHARLWTPTGGAQ